MKFLGVFKKNDDNIYPWYRSTEKISYVSKKLPILISYNKILCRHAIHIIRANLDENVRENNTNNFEKRIYNLSDFKEKQVF